MSVMGHSSQLATRDLLYAPSYRQASIYHDLCYTSCGWNEKQISGSIMRYQSDDLMHHGQTLYHRATSGSCINIRNNPNECMSWMGPNGRTSAVGVEDHWIDPSQWSY